ncbi:Iron(III)-hydroxamate-binding protein fhuD [Glaesserella parasuis]|uniref:iron-siderophore ABC transporter substrate-binding protein n=1 Tax=Glaesserella parasuis TaxID=738 RepID=UPI0004DD7573|nr:iron-siderophore ABC transporter substrate-binding protein [Glaesserella parasuis]KEZ22172.1 Iron(III)-hydroxamate-binding protein fhuD [Glaesserella parasuis]
MKILINNPLARLRERGKWLQAVTFSLFFANPLFAGEPQRSLATLDWTVAETLIALDEQPKAVGDAKNYKVWVSEPKLPENTLDLGIRLQPNPEQLWQLSTQLEAQPLLFINSSFYASATPMLEKFGKVHLVDFYKEGEAWQKVVDATKQIANIIEKPEQADRLLNQYWQKISEIRPLVQPFTDRPVLLVQFIDTRHLRVYAENSPFGAVLSQLGFKNSWQGKHNIWGFEVIEVTQLAKLPPESRFVVVKPYPSNIRSALKYNTLWQKLAMAKDPLILPEVWTFGAIPSAQRFAEVLANGLIHGGEQW